MGRNTIIDPDKLLTIMCTRLDHSRKWWQFWKPKVTWTEHYTVRINSTGELFKVDAETVRMMVPLLEAMERMVRRELVS